MNIPLILTTIIFISSVNYVESLLCYSCSDLKSNEQCFNTTMCPDGEACYGRADGLLTSEVKHTTGCTKELVISITVVTRCIFRVICVLRCSLAFLCFYPYCLCKSAFPLTLAGICTCLVNLVFISFSALVGSH
ncbi:uncharacterized protein LOC132746290 [Ruditapes philippinarum]|uniref:uncharacterized protein LOC132746290 n=1 Tax=Ruditapes philippinarum TaxID=129788 RepID=UPI00295B83EA|nr:uncharacterized protein LOC132746290 [Ruditapes philippinarum]